MDEIMNPGQLLGTETVIKIRELKYNVKIIHCSGNSCQEDKEKYIKCGSNMVIGKPIPIKNINNIICELMNT